MLLWLPNFAVPFMFDASASDHQDEQWRVSMRILLKSFKVCNMHVERYLSRIRRSCPHVHTAPPVERVRAAGFVSEVLTQHRVNGGQDPRFTTSEQLLCKGVPLHRAKRRKTQKVRGSAGFFKFGKQEEDRRRERGETQLQLGGRKRRFEELAMQWGANTQQQRRAFNLLAIEERRETLNDLQQDMQEEPPRTDPISVNGGFWGMSTPEISPSKPWWTQFALTLAIFQLPPSTGHTLGASSRRGPSSVMSETSSRVRST